MACPGSPPYAVDTRRRRQHDRPTVALPIDAKEPAIEPAAHDLCVHEIFERQAAASPNQIAVVFDDKQLTFAQLNARANGLARELRLRGSGPDVLIGLFADRSIEFVVGMLAILKSGGAYVPVDPLWPAKRISLVLQDTAVPILVAMERSLDRLPSHDAELVCVESADAASKKQHESNLPSATDPSNLAYVMYTSGATGHPKGVLVEHRGVVRLVRNTNYFPFGPEDVFLQIAPLCFDVSTLELWGPLLNGGQVVLHPPAAVSIGGLGRKIRRYGIRTLVLTPPLFHAVVDENLDVLSPLTHLIVGGDVISVAHARRVVEQLDTRLTVVYGPTENTCITTAFSPTAAELSGFTSMPLGHPISGTNVVILDESLRPVPQGEIGELCTGGQGVARGYLNQPELTAERFISDPRTNRVGQRLYRTGDLARYLPDGHLEFHGRIDHQVKVRGFRVEPQEIESALRRHPGVSDAVVLARQEQTGDKCLVAYFVSDSQPAPTSADLKAFLKTLVPEYMLPARYVIVDSFPLSEYGKIDRITLAKRS